MSKIQPAYARLFGMKRYDHKHIESKWQKYWAKKGIYKSRENAKKEKRYVLDMFPYPSGEGLHVGHPKGYIATDIYSRHARMQGKEVLHPMGWDAFGLPAENFAIKNKIHPRKAVEKNIKRFKEQLEMIGLDYDWGREINTTDPEFYKWTQWIFLKLYEKGLAYQSHEPINWCPTCQTGLSNEDLEGNTCERCGTIVEKRPMRQWILKITAYADRMLEDLKLLPDWQEHIKESQRNWIGKSEGAEIDFRLKIAEDRMNRVILLHGKGGTSDGDFMRWARGELQKSGYTVEIPALPNTTEPDDIEQAEFVRQNCTIDEKTIIVGHSAGGLAAMRLLETTKAGRLVLVATPFSQIFLDGKVRPTVTRSIERGYDYATIRSNVRNVVAVYDTEDPIIPLSDGDAYAEKLGAYLIRGRGTEGHFNAEKEPDVLMAVTPTIRVFTTRPDTLFGATYLVLAPEHPWVTLVLDEKHDVLCNKKEVAAYVKKASQKTELERQENKEKTGIKLEGVEAIHPATGEKIPLYVADYALAHYGTGAVMAVPAHDERDFEFAKKFDLSVISVVFQNDGVFRDTANVTSNSRPGLLRNSGEYDGIESAVAGKLITTKYGAAKTTYKLRDWVFSRQRYWGEPIPMIHCEKCGVVPVPEKDLPVKLPDVKHYEPTGTGESPLAAIEKWVNVKCPRCKGKAKRETNTMPQWAGSSWYYLRYMDPKNKKRLADPKKEKYWAPVDVYVGGAEHATRHLIYARFWHKFLFDIGVVSTQEPFTRLISVGLIMAEDGKKMSKRYGNVINPDDMVHTYGADTLRIYEMFMGPFTEAIAWNTNSLIGARRFLERVWRLQEKVGTQGSESVEKLLHRTIKKVGEDIGLFKFNTAISTMMIFVNAAEKETLSKEQYRRFLQILAPFAPHIAEDVWQGLGKKTSIHISKWPEYDEKHLEDDIVTIVIQINGKVRASMSASAKATEEEVKQNALAQDTVQKHLEGHSIVRTIFVPGRLLNFVVN